MKAVFSCILVLFVGMGLNSCFDNEINSLSYGNHGTMCAGIIAANHNNIAIAGGIAPNVKLVNIQGSSVYAKL